MSLKSRHQVDPAFSMSSMTDIIFLLLIFFMLTSSFITPSGLPINLPASKTSNIVMQKVSVSMIINLLMELQQRLGLSYLFIAHDLSVVRHIATRVGVMYLGRIVETGPSADLYRTPIHPYTEALLSAVPIPDPRVCESKDRIVLEGEVPSPDRDYPGCGFVDRCWLAQDRCRTHRPQMVTKQHTAACWVRDGEA